MKRKPLRKVVKDTVKHARIETADMDALPQKAVPAQNDDDDDNDEDDDEVLDDEIVMDRTVDGESIPITFEFKDMRDEYYAGISTLMRKMFHQNEAMEFATLTSQQGKPLIVFTFYRF